MLSPISGASNPHMNELVAFGLGLVATWLGLWMNTLWQKRERRKVTFARLFGVLESEHQLVLENEQAWSLYLIYLHFQEKRRTAMSRPNPMEEFTKVQKELHSLGKDMMQDGALKESFEKVRKQIAQQKDSDRQLLRDMAARVRNECARNLPPDEDIALLPYDLVPYFFQYRSRLERIAAIMESFACVNSKSFDEAQFATLIQQIVENILGLFLMSEILRKRSRAALDLPTEQGISLSTAKPAAAGTEQ